MDDAFVGLAFERCSKCGDAGPSSLPISLPAEGRCPSGRLGERAPLSDSPASCGYPPNPGIFREARCCYVVTCRPSLTGVDRQRCRENTPKTRPEPPSGRDDGERSGAERRGHKWSTTHRPHIRCPASLKRSGRNVSGPRITSSPSWQARACGRLCGTLLPGRDRRRLAPTPWLQRTRR